MEITHGRGPQPANETSDGGGTEGRERKTVSEYKYAVAIRKGTDLWLTLWVKRSKVGEFFVLLPRADGQWNPHGSYHLKGQFHQKSNDRKMDSAKQLQPLTGKFTERSISVFTEDTEPRSKWFAIQLISTASSRFLSAYWSLSKA